MKYEAVYFKDWKSVDSCINRYNAFRRHQSHAGIRHSMQERTPDMSYAESRCGNVA
jgi:hypothetical protein